MGEVYRARDTRLEREVAVKVLSPGLTSSDIARERFQREARTIAALHHPHICAIYDVGETPEQQAFIVMEFLQGDTLEERLRSGRLDLPILLDTAIALTDALAAAHAAGIVHRDIKPANVFLTAWGPKLLDFGVAKTAPPVAGANSHTQTDAARPMLTAEGATVGTLAYMSPEQLRGDDVDARTDVFSLGLVLFQMATGRHAFAGATGTVIAAAILHEKPQTPSTLRPELTVRFDEIVLKALEKDRTLRYTQAADLRADLQRLKRDTDGNRDCQCRSRGARARATGHAVADRGSAACDRGDWRRLLVLVVLAPHCAAHRQGNRGPRRLRQHNRRSGVRWHAATRVGDSAPAVNVPQPGLGHAHPAAVAVDGAAGGREAHAGHRP
jgi:serine/threonine protein kinase